MKRLLAIGLPMLAVVTLCVPILTESVHGKVTKGETRPLQTKTLMGKVVRPHCAAVGEGLKAEQVDWDSLRANAELLNECGHILMADKRCPDATWAEATKTLRDCSGVLLTKIEAMDAEGAQGAFKAMTAACASCHKAHKPK